MPPKGWKKKHTAAVPLDDARRYKLTSGIPIPPTFHNNIFIPILKRMKVGQSFGFSEKEQGRVRNGIARVREGAKTMKYTIRVNTPTKGRARCWRIA